MQRGGAIDDGNAGPDRRHAVLARNHGDAGHRLADRVVADLIAIRPELTVRGDVGHDDARVQRLHRLVAEAHLLDRAGAEVLHEHVGNLDELDQDCLARFLAKIHAHALLATVVLHPVRALLADPRRVVPGFLAAETLDLDDLGAEAREHLSAPRSRLMATEIDDADSVQRSSAVGHGAGLRARVWRVYITRAR